MKDVNNVHLVLDTSKLTGWARELSARGMRASPMLTVRSGNTPAREIQIADTWVSRRRSALSRYLKVGTQIAPGTQLTQRRRCPWVPTLYRPDPHTDGMEDHENRPGPEEPYRRPVTLQPVELAVWIRL